MKIKKTVVREVEEISSVTCNMCGENIEKNKHGEFNDYISINKTWGYLSDFDLEEHSFDLCEKCYAKIITNFSIPINKNMS